MGRTGPRTFTLGLGALLLALSIAGCSKSPAEPDPPSSAAAPPPSVPPVRYTTPAAWTAVDTPRGGPKKAEYKVVTAGNDKEEATLEVFFYGTGAEGDPEKRFKEWFGQFDGDVGATAKRDKLSAGALQIETVEVSGTYKIPLGPAVGPKKRTQMQMVKDDFRLVGAVVRTPDRGNWFFKMSGPNETVQAARDAFRTMLESAQ